MREVIRNMPGRLSKRAALLAVSASFGGTAHHDSRHPVKSYRAARIEPDHDARQAAAEAKRQRRREKAAENARRQRGGECKSN